MLLVLMALLLAKIDGTQAAALSSIILAAAALVRSLTLDPRASRLAERKENAELRREVDELYAGKRDAEDREREVKRRLDKAERELEDANRHVARLTGEVDGANARIKVLEDQNRHYRLIIGDIRGER